MECIVCKKQVNEMSLFCDKCGAQLLETKVKLDLNNIDEMIKPVDYQERFDEEFEDEIRKAYYLSLVRDSVSGEQKKNLDKYFDYFFLRLIYEEEKEFFLSDEYPKSIAKEITTALQKRTINKKMMDIFRQKYGQDYINKNIPENFVSKVPNVYITKERNTSKLVKGRSLFSLLFGLVFRFVLTYVFTSILLAAYIYFFPLRGQLTGGGLDRYIIENYVQDKMMIFAAHAGIVFLWSFIKTARSGKVDMVKYSFKKNRKLKKQINKEVKVLAKKIKKRKQTT